ncbi:MAG: UDP-N-acetylmuramoyl-L-alanine--D-glutamate ligase [Candidatus Cloacimonetes bacterium]|nr:UDP-N-acetylmuramoyl-L-alanine--D-glutamate ligase [Candidatus Cloacimonadota bacterium]
MNVKGKSFAIIGMAASGISAARKLQQLGAKVFISEYKPITAIPDGKVLGGEFECEFDGHTARIFEYDTLVISPGVPLSTPIIKQAQALQKEIISEIELGYRLKASDSRIICCTGSNGKSTTVSLIHHILINCGYNAILAGNIGIPVTSCSIDKPGIDFIILELSSFQLELIDSFKADVAILLNITPDHLDRYKNFEHYALTKMNIFKNQDTSCLAVVNADDPVVAKLTQNLTAKTRRFSLSSKADCHFPGNEIICSDTAYNSRLFTLKGPHNLMNIMAVLLAIEPYVTGKEALVKEGLNTFQSLPHRMEFVAEINGVTFINDSKATNTDSVKYALQSYQENVHLILGGSDKGEDFSILLPYLKKGNIKVYLIGATRERMKNAFADQIVYLEFETLAEAVLTAYNNAVKGDIILLSPACASYDSFINFVHRGNTFKEIVRSIAHE